MKVKSKVFIAISIVFFAVTVAFNVNANLGRNAEAFLTLANIEALTQGENNIGKGTLYGNQSGTSYCCASGNNSCHAAPCS